MSVSMAVFSLVSVSNSKRRAARWRSWWPAAFCLLVGGTVSCAATLPTPTAQDVAWAQQNWPDAEQRELEHGRDIYVGKCAGCHNLIEPRRLSAERWSEEVGDMAERARISELEREAVKRYLVTMSRDG